ERLPPAATLVVRLEDVPGDRLADRGADGLGTTHIRGLQDIHFELAADYRRGAENLLRHRREMRETPRDDRVDAVGKLKLRGRRPFPLVAIVPQRTLFDHAAQQLRDDEWIDFGVPV